VEVDRREGRYSMVVWLGIPGVLKMTGWLHGLFFLVVILFAFMTHQHYGYYLCVTPVPFLLLYEHRMAKTLRLDHINRAFFQTNVLVGFLFLLATLAGL